MKRNAFSMIELVFVIVILGVLAAVAVPRFVATRTDAQVATARSDLASVQKAVVAKVFADNIDPTASKVPAPNDPTKSNMITWGEWLIEVGGLDRSRWQVNNNNPIIGIATTNGIGPMGNGTLNDGTAGRVYCGMILGIDTNNGTLEFQPQNINRVSGSGSGTFCLLLSASYANSTDYGNKSIPLASTGTIEF
ncbi:type II secretion system protein [Helicobacter sp. MIT 14-3879]|uniref:type II secretion system protein n=2 Tax=Helicobacter sp. MIT 14-3879 TaxID=2040649 RepID=UPI0015F15E22|nr:type II secretion system protein [Helicobacter sp. MIT 14-3879]